MSRMKPLTLLEETRHDMKTNNVDESQVAWVGGSEQWFTWDEFCSIANVDYDSGFGGQVVATDLIVVGNGWWLERHEYDGSEWWEFKTGHTKPETHLAPPSVVGGCWCRLSELPEEGDY